VAERLAARVDDLPFEARVVVAMVALLWCRSSLPEPPSQR
jgi:hypothetical protein